LTELVVASSVPLEEGFTRDVSRIGHAGTGNLEIRIKTAADLERAQPLLLRSYQGACFCVLSRKTAPWVAGEERLLAGIPSFPLRQARRI
jgi:hypothetical protein